MPRSTRKRSLTTLLAAATAALLIAPVALPAAHASTAKAPVELTFWSWVPKIQTAIDLFNKTHPNIHVKLTYSNCCAQEYTKLNTVLQAKSGAPDVAQIEYDLLPNYEYLGNGALVDMGKYGANAVKGDFPAGIWSQASVGSSVYAIPQDSGPMGLYYRKDIFAKYKIPVPTTWPQYAAAAAALHRADPSLYITNLATAQSDYAWWTGLFWQAGGNMFSNSGQTWTVSVNNAANKKVLRFWGGLANKGLLKVEDNFTQAQYNDWDKGHVATWISAVWGANTILSNATHTSGNWGIAQLPQWPGSKFTTGAWGGSSDVVLSQTKNPAEATTFAVWLNTNADSLSLLIKGAQIWPASNPGLKNPALAAPYPFYGGQALPSIFAKAAANLGPGFNWGPPINFFSIKFGTHLSDAARTHADFAAVLDTVQNETVTFMKQQGFTVQ